MAKLSYDEYLRRKQAADEREEEEMRTLHPPQADLSFAPAVQASTKEATRRPPASLVRSPIQKGKESPFEFEGSDLWKMLDNIPGSAIDNIGLAILASASPLQLMRGLRDIGSGAIHEGVTSLLGEPTFDSPARASVERDREMFRQAQDYVVKRYGTQLRKTIVEDPVGFMVDLSGFLRSVGGAGAAVGRTAIGNRLLQAGRQMGPGNILSQVFGKSARTVGKAVGGIERVVGERVLPEVFHAMTENPPVPFREMYIASKQGGRAKKDAYAAIRGNIPLEELSPRLSEAKEILSKQRSAERRAAMDALPEPEGGVRLDKVKQDVVRYLDEDWNIGVEGVGRTGPVNKDWPKGLLDLDFTRSNIELAAQKTQVRRAVTRLMDWVDNDKHMADNLAQRLSDLIPPRSAAPRRARNINTNIKKMVSRQFYDDVPGAEAIAEKYARESRVLDAMETGLREGSKDNRSVVSAMVGAMGESPTARMQRGVLAELAEKANVHFAPAAAGAELADKWVPRGIYAKGIMAGSITAGTTGVATGIPVLSYAFAGVPMTSPRIVGELFLKLGATPRSVGRLKNWTSDVLQRMDKLTQKRIVLADGITIGTVLQRLEAEGIDIPELPALEWKRPALDAYTEMLVLPDLEEGDFKEPKQYRLPPSGIVLPRSR